MNILTRISRLFKADIHGILDSLEQPEIILQQSVRDMQNEIDKAEIAIADLDKQQTQMEQKNHRLSAVIKELQEQLQFCLHENNESLAKSVIRKKLQAELSVKELSSLMANINHVKKIQISTTEERKEKLQAIRDKLALFTEQNEFNERPPATEQPCHITQDDIELAFLYEKQSFAQTPNQGEQP